MLRASHRRVPALFAALVAVALLLAACGDDDDALPSAASDAVEDASGADGNGDDEFSVDDLAGTQSDADLVVPRDYLQGQWCSSDGNEWTIEGDTAKFVEVSSGGEGEAPVDLFFADSPESALVSQTDDAFTIDIGSDELTFTRGAC